MADNKAELIVDGNIAPLKQKLREAGDELKRFGASGGRDVDGLSGSVMKLTSRFTALGAVLSLGGLASMARQSIDAADKLNDLALRTQTSVKALASFKLIAEQSGTDLDALGKGINKLSIWMAENAAEAKKLGITARDPVQAFIQFTEVLERAATPQDRAAIANKVIGKSFVELIPLLSEGAANLRAAAAASEEYAQKLEKLAPRADTFNDRLAEMSLRWDALKVSMGSALLDMLPNSMTMDKVSARIIELKGNIGSLQRALDNSPGSGLLHKLMYGSKDEITAKLAAARKELADLQTQKTSGSSTAGSGGRITIADLDPTKKDKPAKAKTSKGLDPAEMRVEDMGNARQAADKELADLRRAAEKEIEIRRKAAQQVLQIKLLQVEGERNAEMARIDELAAQSQFEVDVGAATQAEHLDKLAQFNQQRLAADQAYQAQKRELALQDPEQNPVELERIEQEKAEIRRRYAQQGADIQRQQALESQTIWSDLTDTISGLWDKGVQALMNGTLTWRNATQAIGAEMVKWFLTSVVGKKVKTWLAGEAAQTAGTKAGTAMRAVLETAAAAKSVALWAATAVKNIMTSAWEAMAGAYKAIAGIPYVGPFLAPVAAGAAFLGVSKLAKNVMSAEDGYDVPKGVNPMTQLHEQEMVLPKQYANVIRGMAAIGNMKSPMAAYGMPGGVSAMNGLGAGEPRLYEQAAAKRGIAAGGAGEGGEGGSPSTLVVNISSPDARGVRDLLLNNPDALAEAIRKAHRNGFK